MDQRATPSVQATQAAQAAREFQAAQAARVAALPIKEKRHLLQVTRYGDAPGPKSPARGGAFADGERHLDVFFPAYGLFGGEVLCHHILK